MPVNRSSSRALQPGWTMHLPALVQDHTGRGKTQWMKAVIAQVGYFSLSRQDKIAVRRYLEVQTKLSPSAVMRVVLSCRAHAMGDRVDSIVPQKTPAKLSFIRLPQVPRRAVLAVLFGLLVCVQVTQWQKSAALSAALVDAHKLLQSIQDEALKHIKPIKSPITGFSLRPSAPETASTPTVVRQTIVQQLLVRREERKEARLQEAKHEAAPAGAPRTLPQAPLPGVSVASPTVGALLAMLDRGQDGQVLMMRKGKLVWADVVAPGGGGTIRDTGGRRPIPAGEERSYGGAGAIQIINTTQVHNHTDDAGGGKIDLLAATLGTLTAARGGTGFSSYAVGDLLVGSGSSLNKLALGTSGYVLTSSGGTVQWLNPGSIPSAGGWTDDGPVVRLIAPTDRVAIGTATPVNSGKLTISTASGSGPAIVLTGSGVSGGHSDAGVFITAGVNNYNNRQITFGDTDRSNTGAIARFYFYNQGVGLDAVSRDGISRKDLVIGTNTTNIAIGNTAGNFTMPSGIKTIFYSEQPKVSVAIRAASSQTGSLLELQNSAGTVITSMSQTGWLAIGTSAKAKTPVEVFGTLSGTTLNISSGTNLQNYIGGKLAVNKTTNANAAFEVAGLISGSQLNIHGGSSYFIGNVGVGRINVAPKAQLEVLGTISGSLITQNGAGNNYFRGNLGIGVSTPQSVLDLMPNGVDTRPLINFRSEDGATRALLARSNGTNDVVIGAAAQDFVLRTEGGNMLFSVNGGTSAGLAVHSGGNVGISTVVPKAKLDVVGTASASALTVTGLKSCALITTDINGATSCGALSSISDSRYVNVSGDTMTGALAIQNGNTHSATATPLLNVRGTMSGRSLYISGTGSSPLLITNITTGRVGIGTQSPVSKFHVLGTSGVSPTVTIEDAGTAAIDFVGGEPVISYRNVTNLRIATVTGGNYANYLDIARFTGAGNFLLGTNTPRGKFTVAGSGSFTGSISGALLTQNGAGDNYFLGNLGIGKTVTKSKLDVVGTISGSALQVNGASEMWGILTLRGENPNSTLIDMKGFADNYIRYYGGGSTSTLRWYTGVSPNNGYGTNFVFYNGTTSAPAIVIQSADGNVGIGTSAPKAKLDVVGTISGSALTINGTSTFNGNLVPFKDNAYDLGTTSTRWRQLYLSGGSLHIGTSSLEGSIGYRSIGTEGLLFYSKTPGSVPSMFMSSGGVLAIGTTLQTGTSSGDLVLRNNRSVRFANSTNTSALQVLSVDSSNRTVLGQTANTTFVKGASVSYFGNTHSFVDVAGSTEYALLNSSEFRPGTDNTVSVGTSVYRWKNAFFSGNMGIGVASGSNPITQLHVPGTASVSASSVYSSLVNGRDIVVRGHYAYVVDEGDDKFKIFDVSTPTSPTLLSQIATTYVNPWSLAVEGNYAYVTLRGTAAVEVFSISNPNAPSPVATFVANTTPYGISVVGRYAYVAETGKLEIVDVANPANLVQVASIATTGTAGTSSDVVVSGNVAYMVGQQYIDAFNVSDPASPSLISTYTVGTDLSKAVIEGKYLYVVDEGSAIRMIDVSNPAAMTETDSDGSYAYAAVFAQGRRIYGLGSGGGCDIFDVSNPASITAVGTSCGISGGSAMWVQGRYWYMLDGGTNIEVAEVGGSYIQQLQAGGMQVGTLDMLGDFHGKNGSFEGGLTVGNAFQVNGDAGVKGELKATSVYTSGITLPGYTVNTVPYINGSNFLVSSTSFQFDGTNVGLGQSIDSIVRLKIGTSSTAAKALVLKGTAGQTAHLFTTENSAGNTTSFISASGSGSFSGLALGKTQVAGRKLDVAGTMSGQSLYITGTGSSPLLVTNITSGRVGIGTSSPKAKLDVVGTLSGRLLTINGGTGSSSILGALGVGTTTPNALLHVYGANAMPEVLIEENPTGPTNDARLRLRAHSNDVLILSANGGTATVTAQTNLYLNATAVGIGKITPATNIKLDVVGAISGSALVVNGTMSGRSIVPIKDNSYDLGTTSTRWRQLYLSGGSLHIGTSAMEGKIGYKSSGFEGLQFYGSGSNATAQMLLSSGGLLGIGTVTPKTKLEVVGTISGSLLTQNGAGSNYFRGNVAIGVTAPLTELYVSTPGAAGSATIAVNGAGASAISKFSMYRGGSEEAYLQTDRSTGLTTLSSLYPIILTPATNVGIGTTAPKAKLDVVGTISGALVQINGSATGQNYIRGNLGIGRTTANTKLEVLGTISGSVLTLYKQQNGNALIVTGSGNVTGSLAVDTNTLYVDSSLDRVGIGTTSPFGKLDVNSATGLWVRNGATDGFAFQQSNTNSWTWSGMSGGSYFNIQNASVGIGTTTPKAALQVVGAISGSALHLEGTNLGQQHQLEVFGTNAGWGAGMLFGMAGTNNRGLLNFGVGSATDLSYSTSADASSYTQRLLVTQAGNMVLGSKTTATVKLDVVGTISGSLITQNGAGSNYLRGNLGIGTTTPLQMLDVYTTGTTAQANVTIDNAGADGTASLYINSGGASGSNGNNRANLTLNTSHSGCLQCANINFNEDGAVKWLLSYDTGFDRLAFYTAANGTDPSLTLLETGFIGVGKGNGAPGAQFVVSGSTVIGNNIGSRAAKAQLDVVGTISGTTLTTSNINGTNYIMGALGIGTMSPSEKLEVAGGLHSVQVNQNRVRYRYGSDAAGIYRYQLYDNVVGTLSGVGNSPALFLTSGDSSYRSALLGLSDGLGVFVGTTETNPTEKMRITNGGNVGIGITAPGERLSVSGAILIDADQTQASQNMFKIITNYSSANNTVYRITGSGATYADAPFNSAGADYAEWFASAEYQTLRPGDLVCIDPVHHNSVQKCASASDPNLMGIISSKPSFVGNSVTAGTVDLQGVPIPGYVLVGLIGQVPAKAIVESQSGQLLSIHPGDPLTSSSLAGYARKALPGESTVGVALEGLENGQGTINVLIARTNRSLTVDMLDQKVRDNIASLQIGTQIAQELQTRMNGLNLDATVRDQVTALTTTPITQLQAQVAELQAMVRAMSGAIVGSAEGSHPGSWFDNAHHDTLTLTGALAAASLTSESTLTVASDARVGGDLYLEGVLRVASILVPNGLTVEGDMVTGRLVSASGSVVQGLLTVQGDMQVMHNLSMGSGSLLTAHDLTVGGALVVIGPVNFLGDVSVHGTLSVSAKQAGSAEIAEGESAVTVTFQSGGFLTVPTVTATPHGRVGSEWWIEHATQTGFTIRTDLIVPHNVSFNWLALPTAMPEVMVQPSFTQPVASSSSSSEVSVSSSSESSSSVSSPEASSSSSSVSSEEASSSSESSVSFSSESSSSEAVSSSSSSEAVQTASSSSTASSEGIPNPEPAPMGWAPDPLNP